MPHQHFITCAPEMEKPHAYKLYGNSDAPKPAALRSPEDPSVSDGLVRDGDTQAQEDRGHTAEDRRSRQLLRHMAEDRRPRCGTFADWRSCSMVIFLLRLLVDSSDCFRSLHTSCSCIWSPWVCLSLSPWVSLRLQLLAAAASCCCPCP